MSKSLINIKITGYSNLLIKKKAQFFLLSSIIFFIALWMVFSIAIPRFSSFNWKLISKIEFKILSVFSFPLKSPDSKNTKTKIILGSHRGIHNEILAENSEQSIIETLNCGFRYIEVDISFSKDFVPFLFHDSNFQNKCNVPGNTWESDWEEIKNFRLYDGQKILSLKEFSGNYSSAFSGIILDLKTSNDNHDKKAVSFLESINSMYDTNTKIYVIGLSDYLLINIKKNSIMLNIACENRGILYSYIKGYHLISLDYYREFSLLEYLLAKKLDIEILTWTVNDIEILNKLRNFEMIVLTDLTNSPLSYQ